MDSPSKFAGTLETALFVAGGARTRQTWMGAVKNLSPVGSFLDQDPERSLGLQYRTPVSTGDTFSAEKRTLQGRSRRGGC